MQNYKNGSLGVGKKMSDDTFRKYGWLKQQKKVTLYKCFTFNDNSKNPLRDNCLFYNDAKGFNDPYDCNARLIKTIASNFGSKFHRPIAEQESVIEKAIERANNMGIICFSPHWDNILMWAHYGNSFKGFSLGVEFELPVHKYAPGLHEIPLQEYNGTTYNYSDYELEEVHYATDENFPSVAEDVSFADADGEYYNAILYRKSKDWSYEKEIRLTCIKGKGTHPVPGKIKEVLFGLRMSDDEKRELKQIIESHTSDVVFFDTNASDNKYVVERRISEI